MAGEIVAFLVAQKGAALAPATGAVAVATPPPTAPRDQIVAAVGWLAAFRRDMQQQLDDARTARNADDPSARGAFEQVIQTLGALVREADKSAGQLADLPPLIDQLAQVQASV